MKIVVLTSRFPYPLDKGDKVRAFNQIKELSKFHEVYLLSISENQVAEAEKEQLSPYCELIDIQYISSNKRYLNLASQFFSSKPWQVGYFYDEEVNRHIQMMIEEINPDHIYTQLIRMAPYAIQAKGMKSIDFMDSIPLNMGEVGIRGLKRLPFMNRIEKKKAARYERSIFNEFQYHFTISQKDKEAFASPIQEKIELLPNGVDTTYFEPIPSIVRQFDAAFVGNLGYIHNDRAAHYLIDEVMPLLSGDVRILIAGSRPSDWLNIKQRSNIRVEGWTEDIRHHYQRANVLIAPIFTGSGQQNKILEAMAQGIPCITTSFVNESIGAIPNEQILIADTPKRMAGDIQQLKVNKDLWNQLSYAGRNFVKDNFDWSNATEPLLQKLNY